MGRDEMPRGKMSCLRLEEPRRLSLSYGSPSPRLRTNLRIRMAAMAATRAAASASSFRFRSATAGLSTRARAGGESPGGEEPNSPPAVSPPPFAAPDAPSYFSHGLRLRDIVAAGIVASGSGGSSSMSRIPGGVSPFFSISITSM